MSSSQTELLKYAGIGVLLGLVSYQVVRSASRPKSRDLPSPNQIDEKQLLRLESTLKKLESEYESTKIEKVESINATITPDLPSLERSQSTILKRTSVKICPVAHIEEIWPEDKHNCFESPLVKLYSQLAMGQPTAETADIFQQGEVFGLHEKYYRDLSELQSSFKFMIAAARQFIAVNPQQTVAAIVTCGGITPGVNCVIKSLYTCLAEQYKVKKTIGVRMGMYGLMQADDKYWVPLTN